MKLKRAELDYRDLTDKALQAYVDTDDQFKYYTAPDGVYYIWDRCGMPLRIGSIRDVVANLELMAEAET